MESSTLTKTSPSPSASATAGRAPFAPCRRVEHDTELHWSPPLSNRSYAPFNRHPLMAHNLLSRGGGAVRSYPRPRVVDAVDSQTNDVHGIVSNAPEDFLSNYLETEYPSFTSDAEGDYDYWPCSDDEFVATATAPGNPQLEDDMKARIFAMPSLTYTYHEPFPEQPQILSHETFQIKDMIQPPASAIMKKANVRQMVDNAGETLSTLIKIGFILLTCFSSCEMTKGRWRLLLLCCVLFFKTPM